MEIFGFTGLQCVYALVAVVSFLFAVASLVGAEFGDALDVGTDVAVDADVDTGADFANVSTFALAVFGATFGLVGMITSVWAEMEPIPSILISAAAGLVVGGLAQVLFIYVLSPSRSSHFSLQDDAVGREVEVTISIPAEGKGQIAYNNVSGRVTLGARSSTGESIPAGKTVVIERVSGRNAFVRPAELK
jgi:membrane protein implicated in regulation of membrane protease activity